MTTTTQMIAAAGKATTETKAAPKKTATKKAPAKKAAGEKKTPVLQAICKELKIEPRVARRRLRAAGMKAPYADAAKIRKALEAKPEAKKE